MSEIDKEKLRKLAEKATPGPWVAFAKPTVQAVFDSKGPQDNSKGAVVNWPGFDSSAFGNSQRRINARYIAAANPATTLSLLDELDAALAELAALKGGREPFMWVRIDNGHIEDYTQDKELAEIWQEEDFPVTLPLYTAPPAQASAWVPEVEDWSVFIGYLIDNYEGHEIAEERLQGWLSEMLRDPRYGALFRREKVNAGQPSPIALAIEAAEEEHGSLRAAAKALGIDPGYLSRLASGEKTNPSDKVLSALGLERVTMYRAAAPTPGASDGKGGDA